MLFTIRRYEITYYTPQELQEFEKSKYEVKNVSNIKEGEKEFGDQVKLILVNSKFDNSHYNEIISTIGELKPEYRKGYVDNLQNFIIEGKKYSEDKFRNESKNVSENIINSIIKQYKKDIESASIISYDNMYISQVNNIEIQKETNNITRLWLFGIMLSCILIFISFLIVPLLIRIEENTRK